MSIKSYIANLIPYKIKNSIRAILYKQWIDEISIVLRYFKNANGSNFTMVDVGAHHGGSLIPFAKKKWTIYAFEPDQNNLKLLLKNIKKYKNVNLDKRAVSIDSNKNLPFYTSKMSSGISGLSAFDKSHVQTAEVGSIRLDDFLGEKNFSKIDFLKIDTEGYDLMVLKSYDWKKFKHPELILVEFEDKKTTPLGYTLNDMLNFLKQYDYKFIISEWHPIVEYGKRHKWKKFVTEANEITNKLAWGNVIAVKNDKIKKLLESL